MRSFPLLIGLSRCIGLAVCLSSLNLFAQDGYLRTDLISPSPTAAQLAKYGEIPVTYYTGIPNVSIPIFNVTGNELSLPITLTYNYSGNKPGQKASWVGLGWSLQAGGVITRTVGDRLDEEDGYDIDSASQVTPDPAYLYRSRYFGLHDNLPDVYSFNFGNYSGKFIYEHGNYYIMPKQKLLISGTGFGDFIITTEDGTRYFFEVREYTTAKPVEPAPGSVGYNVPQHISTWYLTEISNATDTESIRLTYDEDGTMEQLGVRTQSCRKPTSTINQQPVPSPPSDILPTRVTIQRLTSIVSDKYKIDFLSDSVQREDIEMYDGETYSLREIRVSSKEGYIKVFQFEQDYTPGGETTKALRLRSVTDHAGGGRLNKHTFSYYNEDENIGSGTSSPVDKFGYFRFGGASNMLISNEIYDLGVDRTPDFYGLLTGGLRTITYPTGGSTTFTYELNRYNDGDRNAMENKIRGLPATRSNPSTTNEIYGIDTFLVSHEQYVKVLFTRADKDGPYDPETDPHEVWHDNVQEFEIRPVNRVLDEEGNFLFETVGLSVYNGEILENEDNVGKTDSVLLEPGKYIIKTICDDHELEVTAMVFYKFDTGVPSPGVPGPGMRVKSVVHENGYGKTIQKRFTYVKENGHCSGSLLQSTSYAQNPVTDVIRSSEAFGAILETRPYNVYTATVAERDDLGLPFYYTSVIEDSESGDEVHRTVYSYNYFASTQNVELLSQTQYVQQDTAFVPLAKDEFTFSNSYNYESVNGLDIFVKEHHSYIESSLAGYDVFDATPKNWVEYWKYTSKTKQTRYEKGQELTTETKSYYDPNGTRNLIATKTTLSDSTTLYTRYKYPEDYKDIPDVSDLVSANILSPVIEEQVWKRISVNDSIMISGRINEYEAKRLKAIYVLESAEEIHSLNDEDTVHVSGKVKYVNLLSDNLYYNKKIEFTYDPAGRLLSQQLTDQPVVSYLWGYPGFTETGSPVHGDTYPVAEIKNALPDVVFYTSFEYATGTSSSASYTGIKCKQDSFKIKKSFTGSYMLTYWKKTGSDPWKLITQTLSSPSNYIISASGSYIDEVRLYPVDAQMTTYAYRPGTGISQMVDVNNRITYYEYDAAGRLNVVKDRSKNITNNYKYHVKDEAMLSVE